jgi:alpha-1,3-mannosyltransferase
VEEVVLNLSLGLVREGWDVRIVTLDRLFRAPLAHLPSAETVAGLPVMRIPFCGSTRYPIAPQVLLCISESEIVHVHCIDFFFDFLALTKPIHRKKMIATTHGGFFHTDFAARLKRAYFTTITRLSALAYERIVAGSQNDAELFAKVTSRVVTIETGASVQKYSNCAAQEAKRTIIYFGRLSKNKRLPAVISLLAELRSISPDWSLIVAGTEFDETFSALSEHARRLGVEKAVRFVAAPADGRLAGLIGEASYFISLSSYEAFGISVVEAMSAGLVPILSDIPSFRELVRRAGSGLIVEVGDLRAAAESVAAFDAGGPATDRLIYIKAAEKYDWPRMTEAYLGEYRRILASA